MQSKRKKHSKKQINLSFDEWNIWYHSTEHDQTVKPWQVAPPLLEDHYNFEDALVLGCLLITLLKHSDRVKIACLAQLVNVIAPIMTDEDGETWRQTIYYPFMQVATLGQGIALRPEITVDTYATSEFETVPYLESIAVLNEEKNELVIFAVNRGEEEMSLDLQFSDLKIEAVIEFSEMSGYEIKAVNRAGNEQIKPASSKAYEQKENQLNCKLKPLSWNVIRTSLTPNK